MKIRVGGREMDIEIVQYNEPGYKAVAVYEEWRVAVLNDCEELKIDHLNTMQKHCETDEIFVLLKGSCMLFSAGQGEMVGEISGVRLELYKIYNVKKGVWHTHALESESSVLIIENQNTCDENSPISLLTPEQKENIRKIYIRE